MGGEILPKGHAAGDHGLGFGPVLFDEEGEIDVADQAGEKGGGEEPVKNSGEVDEVPPRAEERQGKKTPERLPENHPGQDQEEQVPGHGPVEDQLAGMILSGQGIVLRKAEEVLEDG